MKMKPLFMFWVFVSLLKINTSFAQAQLLYQLPESYHFDYEITQVLSGKKNAADTSVMHFFYTKSGEYAAAGFSGKGNMKGNLFVVLTRDGTGIIFDEHSKNVTIISIRKLVSDISALTKWIRMDSLLANMRKKMDGKDFQSTKTGNTKQTGNYTSEEFLVTDSKGHKGTVWCTKVDFNTQGDYLMGALGGNLLQMMGSRISTHPLLQTLTQPKTIVTEVRISDSTGSHGMEMYTVGINQVSKTVPTTGYMVSNYSNMTLPEIFGAEMKKRNN